MGILEIFNTIDSLELAKEALQEACKNAKDGKEEESYLGALAILAEKCGEYLKFYEEESKKCPNLTGIEW